MGIFQCHTDTTAPADAAPILSRIKERYGFIPNLAAYISEAPAVLGGVLAITEAFDKTTLTAREQQVVLLTVSTLNECSYCKTVHTALGKKVQLDAATLLATAASERLVDKKLNALREFTKLVVDERGRVSEATIQAFLDAGYTRAQAFEVVMGVAIKTLTNYCNHLAGAVPNPEFVAMAADETAG